MRKLIRKNTLHVVVRRIGKPPFIRHGIARWWGGGVSRYYPIPSLSHCFTTPPSRIKKHPSDLFILFIYRIFFPKNTQDKPYDDSYGDENHEINHEIFNRIQPIVVCYAVVDIPHDPI